ncbi:MAG: hypothetical protein V1775_08280 [Bacteroidota bacterium]
MDNSFTHKQVNWQDGMRIDKNHFVATDHFHIDHLNVTRSILLHENNFGLLPSRDKTRVVNEIKLVSEGGLIKIERYSIAALMFNGMLLMVDSDELNSLNMDTGNIQVGFDLNGFSEKDFCLLVKVNSFDGLGFGTCQSDDVSLRRPFLISHFNFLLLPESKVKDSYFGDDFLILEKFSVSNTAVVPDTGYIPPVTAMIAHELLVKYHKYVYDTINTVELCLIEIGRRYSNMNAESFRDTLIILSNNLLNALARIKPEIKHRCLYESPFELIIRIKELANILNYTLTIRTSIGKDRFLDEVNRILGASKFEFEEMIKQIINLEYRHYNISDAVSVTREFLEQISKIFQSLSEFEKSKKSADIFIKK